MGAPTTAPSRSRHSVGLFSWADILDQLSSIISASIDENIAAQHRERKTGMYRLAGLK